MKQELRESKQVEQLWDDFLLQFNHVHPDFFDKFKPFDIKLSAQDKKHLAYLRMGLSNKEIASSMNIQYPSVKVIHARLKKRMQLKSGDTLRHFIQYL